MTQEIQLNQVLEIQVLKFGTNGDGLGILPNGKYIIIKKKLGVNFILNESYIVQITNILPNCIFANPITKKEL